MEELKYLYVNGIIFIVLIFIFNEPFKSSTSFELQWLMIMILILF